MKKTTLSIFSVIIIFSFIFSSQALALIYQLDFTTDKDYNITLGNVRLLEEDFLNVENAGEIAINLLNSSSRQIASFKREVSFVILSDPPATTDFSVILTQIPYYQNGRYLQIKHKNVQKILYDLNELCNKNKVCESPENHISCPSDCKADASDNICLRNRRVCDPDCAEYQTCLSSCTNGQWDWNEDDADCGGTCPNKCEVWGGFEEIISLYNSWEKGETSLEKVLSAISLW